MLCLFLAATFTEEESAAWVTGVVESLLMQVGISLC